MYTDVLENVNYDVLPKEYLISSYPFQYVEKPLLTKYRKSKMETTEKTEIQNNGNNQFEEKKKEINKIPSFEKEVGQEKPKTNKSGNMRGMFTGKAKREKKEQQEKEELEKNQPFSFISESTMRGVVAFPFKLAARFTNNNKWLLEENEVQDLLLPADEVIRKYVPATIEEYGSEITLTFLLAVLIESKMNAADKFLDSPENATK
tara:strand:+ start:347 stop:961 length:615 start_codon:yes stop_codon:yes gene_type:complete